MLQRVLKFGVLISLLMMSLPVLAQANMLAYGDIVTGTLEDMEDVIEYTFKGAADDVIVIEMNSAVSRDVFTPSLILISPSGNPLTGTPDSSGTPYFGSLSYVLPADGAYTIQAAPGRFDSSTGEFTLSLIEPELLEADAVAEGAINSDTGNRYYYVETEGASTVEFVMMNAQEFVPRFIVRDAETFRTQGSYLSFNPASSGSITGVLDGGGVLLVSVEYSADDLYSEFSEPAAEYQISVVGE